jgi:hypothetical protein
MVFIPQLSSAHTGEHLYVYIFMTLLSTKCGNNASLTPEMANE